MGSHKAEPGKDEGLEAEEAARPCASLTSLRAVRGAVDIPEEPTTLPISGGHWSQPSARI